MQIQEISGLKNSSKLINNTIMLYILTFSTYFFNLITVPYQTRVLGPEFYGRINFASAFVTYFQLFMDFGFILSGTEQIAANRNNIGRISVIYTAICASKLILIALATAVLLPILYLYGPVRESAAVIVFYYLSICVYTFFPDYLYRGMENMRSITVRNVAIRLFFTIMIFVVVKAPEDYLLIPLLTLAGNTAAIAFTVYHVKKTFGVTFCRINFNDIKKQLHSSSMFFYSRIASTVLNSTNTFIAGIIYGTASMTLGLFSSANKLVSVGKQAITPITDSLYPYMVAEKNYKAMKKALLIFMPLITAGCILLFIIAEPICIIVLGAKYAGSAIYLRLLTPLLWTAFPSMLFGFPMLSPVGLSRYVNMSNIIGAVIQICFLLIGAAAGWLSMVYICIATCLTDFLTMCFRIGVFVLYRKGMIKGTV